MSEDLEGRLRTRLRELRLPPAPGYLRSRAAVVMNPVLREPEPKLVSHRREPRSGNPAWLLLPVAATIAALVGMSLLMPASPPPTVVDGLPVMTVSQVLAQRAVGGLRQQQVAVGGYWTYAVIPHSCAVGGRSELEPACNDREYGITQLNEPVLKFGRYAQIQYVARGPHLTPYLAHDLAGLDPLFGLPRANGEQYPPTPIVVVGHFDDPLAERCRQERKQACRDRLVVDRIAYFNPDAARWAPGIPTVEPSPPPPPPTP